MVVIEWTKQVLYMKNFSEGFLGMKKMTSRTKNILDVWKSWNTYSFRKKAIASSDYVESIMFNAPRVQEEIFTPYPTASHKQRKKNVANSYLLLVLCNVNFGDIDLESVKNKTYELFV